MAALASANAGTFRITASVTKTNTLRRDNLLIRSPQVASSLSNELGRESEVRMVIPHACPGKTAAPSVNNWTHTVKTTLARRIISPHEPGRNETCRSGAGSSSIAVKAVKRKEMQN
jgi:hypothetical protein